MYLLKNFYKKWNIDGFVKERKNFTSTTKQFFLDLLIFPTDVLRLCATSTIKLPRCLISLRVRGKISFVIFRYTTILHNDASHPSTSTGELQLHDVSCIFKSSSYVFTPAVVRNL